MGNKSITNLEMSLHWIVGIGMIVVISIGVYMTQMGAIALFDIHRSVGMILFVFIVWRIALRMRYGWPEYVSSGTSWDYFLARLIHWLLALGTIIMPVSGMVSTYMAGHGLSVFGLEIAAANLGGDGRAVAIDQGLADQGKTVHQVAGKVLIGAIILHIAGALKQHVLHRDDTLLRMLGKA